ncbi:penicillin acylase family protein [Rubrivirga sp. IMCC45206]|uniref:penicillin acylase family protein n=1 Tax=Rubrivirga sp. IMCC45206 TaxID=3391614 RepID=UPI0039901167
MKRALLIALIVLLALVVLGAGSLWTALRASLPDLDGTETLAGLSAEVSVERDAAGVPTITAATRADAARALGYVHAQERWFQMDLLRRAASGELSALLGEATWRTDSTLRPHRLRARARAVVEALPADQRAVLDAYTAGANAGLDALGARPFEYLALRQAPRPWQPEDGILAAFAMYLDLQFDGGYGLELERDALTAALPDVLADFLMPTGDAWDAPLEGDTVEPPPIPTAAQLGDWQPGDEAPAPPEPDVLGSNNWAVAGDLTETGAALVADDMHLGLRLPHIWFRASLVVDGRRITGVTLPGAPLVIVGSNGDVAWGFTNSYGDYIDYVRLVEPEPGLIATASGTVALDTLREQIAVGDEVRELVVLDTPFGPVTATGPDGARYAMQWGAHRPEATNLGLLDAETATTLDEVLDAANRSGIPAQNFVAGDRAGRIGWTIAGQIPLRVGRDGRRPVDSTDPNARWDRFLRPDEVPRIVDPADGRLWSANSRVASGDALAAIGDANYAHGARARQIRDGLAALTPPVDERDLLAIQLDDRALFYARWRDLLRTTLTDAPATDDLDALRRTVEDWSGHADDAGYRLVRRFRDGVVDRTLPPLLASVRALAPRAGYPARDETAVWALVTEQPAHLLPPGHASWDALLLDAAAEVARGDLDTAWADDNALVMAHPMADALPGIGGRLRMPSAPQRGDSRMPRVAGPSMGASQRMVVSPGFEERGIFHMPGGQAGHFLSPYWGAGHDDWAEGRPSPFLPGPTVYRLTLTPAE